MPKNWNTKDRLVSAILLIIREPLIKKKQKTWHWQLLLAQLGPHSVTLFSIWFVGGEPANTRRRPNVGPTSRVCWWGSLCRDSCHKSRRAATAKNYLQSHDQKQDHQSTGPDSGIVNILVMDLLWPRTVDCQHSGKWLLHVVYHISFATSGPTTIQHRVNVFLILGSITIL